MIYLKIYTNKLFFLVNKFLPSEHCTYKKKLDNLFWITAWALYMPACLYMNVVFQNNNRGNKKKFVRFFSSYSQYLCSVILVSDTVSLRVSFCWLAAVGLFSCDSKAESLICVLGFFSPFFDMRYCLMASITSETVQCCRVRASCSVNGPSLVLLTPLHIAVLRSSSPISCTTLRRYFWVSFTHCTSKRRGREGEMP